MDVGVSQMNATRFGECRPGVSACVATKEGALFTGVSSAFSSYPAWNRARFSPSLDGAKAWRTPGPLGPAALCLRLESAHPVESVTQNNKFGVVHADRVADA